jgi:MFS family permease
MLPLFFFRYVLPAELLHGLTFSLSWAAMASHSAVLAPPGYTSTTQGLASALFFGLGFGAGALAGGFIAQQLGFRTLFQGVGVLTLVVASGGFIAQRFCRMRSSA